ncbi:MAG: sulfotransferase [Desulfobacteraceae bacterium]|jgi:hypothetical protein|nr:sulfotransferase [Desulfobacteraceae bacterium]
MIIAIGNAPSSGSTLLADLLDSLPFSVCGPELNLFSLNKYFSDFEKVKQNHSLSSKSALIYQGRQRLLTEYLRAYGLNQKKINAIYDESATFVDFCHKLFEAFAKFRGKECQVFFEKTPQNIHCARAFLDTFEDGFFLHIVRNPLLVYKSLIRRNLPPYIAANTWLIDVSRAYQLRNNPRLIEVKYETLVQEPAETIGKILKKIGIDFEPGRIIDLYKSNQYRKKNCVKLDTWEISKYGILGNANKKTITNVDLKALAYMLKSKISQRYANIFDLDSASFKDLIQHYGYGFDNLISKNDALPSLKLFNTKALQLLVRKFLGDVKFGECRLVDILAYLRPVELQSCVV